MDLPTTLADVRLCIDAIDAIDAKLTTQLAERQA